MERAATARITTLVVLGGLAALAGLGVLQVRWVDAWSRGEEVRLRRFVESGASRVALDLERGLAALEESLGDALDSSSGLAESLPDLAQAPAGTLRPARVIWLDPDRPDAPQEIDARSGAVAPVGWASLGDWEPLARALLERERTDVTGQGTLTLPASPPGVVVPVLPAAGGRMHVVLLLLDPGELARDWLAARVEEQLVEPFGGAFLVAVTCAGQVVHATRDGVTAGDLEIADAAVAVGGGEQRIARSPGGRLVVERRGVEEDSRRVVEVETSSVQLHADDGPSGAGPPLVLLPPTWEVRARHVDGSIAESLNSRRRGQLALGLGLLALLAVAAGLLLVIGLRARALARRQVAFVAGVTHELRTPLTVILSAAENLRDSVVRDPGHARRYGGLIHDEARRLTEFVENALSLAGARRAVESPALTPFDAAPVVRRAVERRGVPPDAPAIEVDLPAALPPVLGDPNAVEQALDNLLANALKYGGNPPRVRVRARPEDGGLALTVQDDGPGVPDDERARLFEPFFRGRAARRSQAPGSGLGLAVARRLIEAQGGSISIDGDGTGGGSFTLHLRSAG